MSRHTPGPWNPVRSATCGHLRAAHNYQSNPRNEWTDADIALIKAAPDLLEFAKQVVKFAADHSNFYLMAWAQDVVNKAEAKP